MNMINYYYDNEEDKVYTRMELGHLYEQDKANCISQTFTEYLTAACEKNGTLTPLRNRWCVVSRSEYDGILGVHLSSTAEKAEQLLEELFNEDVQEYGNRVYELHDNEDNWKNISLVSGDSVTYTTEEVIE